LHIIDIPVDLTPASQEAFADSDEIGQTQCKRTFL